MRTRTAVIVGALVCCLVAREGRSQSTAAFEVASVKLNTAAAQGMTIQTPAGGRFTATNVPLWLLAGFAHDVQRFRLIGLPAWSDRFDIVAKLAAEPANPADRNEAFRAALRALLADRFKLVTHRETRDVDVFALLVARPGRLGPKIKASATDCSPEGAPARRALAARGGVPVGMCGSNWSGESARFGGLTMAALAAALSPVDERLVVDRTGLTGTWDAELTYAAPAPAGAPASDLPDLFTALQEQLGLKLERAKAPVEMLVIDSVQRPNPD